MVTVFISYAADDPAWPGHDVERLAGLLREAGAEVLLDRWAQKTRNLSDEEWRGWMRKGLRSADHVLCLASDHYNDLAQRRVDTPAGRGVAFESVQIAAWLYEQKQNSKGRIWLYRPPQTPDPDFLSGGVCQRYTAPVDEARLVAHLCGRGDSASLDPWRRLLRAMLDEERTALYVPLAGRQEQPAVGTERLPQSVLHLLHEEFSRAGARQATEYRDILHAVGPQSRALVLGEPGAGKTFALLKVLERDLGGETVPLWIRLSHWIDPGLDFERFAGRELSALGP